jgi:tyrosyl-tRNA synthetase
MAPDKAKIKELLTRGVDQVIDGDHLRKRLESGEKLRVKLGIDPTSPNIHIGRSIPLLKLRDLQDLGHQVVFIVGDFTGVIGDTSDKDAERPMLALEQIRENMKSYVDQAAKILDIDKVEVVYNSEWLSKLTFKEVGELADQFSLAEFVARENIAKRLKAGKRVSLRELLYPLMQGYDSVMVKSDVELGGTDQWFNLLAGRELQRHYKQEPQDILTTNLIMGTDGRKMSSSWGNTVNLTDTAKDMFGKIMSIPDAQIIPYAIHCTRIPMDEVQQWKKGLSTGANPRDAKLKLAVEITRMYHGDTGAAEGEEYFRTVFQSKEIPGEVPEFELVGKTIVDALIAAGLADSKSDAKRLIQEKGVKMNEELVESFDLTVPPGAIIQKGKRGFAKAL